MRSTDEEQDREELLAGTLDLMVLQALALGPMHGYGLAQRIRQVSQEVLQVSQGSLYPALLRLEQQGWIAAKWATTENNRRAKYYSLTRAGKRQLAQETERWTRLAAAIGRLLAAAAP